MALSPEQIAKIAADAADAAVAAAVAADQPDAVTAKVLANAPTPRSRRSRKTETTAKVEPVVRNFTKMLMADGKVKNHADGVAMPDSGVVFRVDATSNGGSPLTSGALVAPFEDGNQRRRLSVGVLRALQGEGVLEGLIHAIESVNERAQLGSHAPAKVEA